MDEFEKALNEALDAEYKGATYEDHIAVAAAYKRRNEARAHVIALHRAALEDAERYRWLRSRTALTLQTSGIRWKRQDGTEFIGSHYLAADNIAYSEAPTLDETIDAARSKS